VCGDVIFGTRVPLEVLKEYLVKLLDSSDLAVRQKAQLILCALVSDTDTNLFSRLCVTDEIIKSFVQRLQSYKKLEEIKTVLQRIKSLANISNNRILLRRYKALSILEDLSEQHSGSEIETLSAEGICLLLSDPTDGLQVEISQVTTITSGICFVLRHACTVYIIPDFHQSEMMELLLKESSGVTSGDDVPQELVHHASQLCQLMSLAYTEFHRVLYSNKLTDKTFLVQGAKALEELCKIYEENDQKSRLANNAYGKQIVGISKQYLPEMICVSFKALKDGFSDSLLGKFVKFNLSSNCTSYGQEFINSCYGIHSNLVLMYFILRRQ